MNYVFDTFILTSHVHIHDIHDIYIYIYLLIYISLYIFI